MSVNRAVIYRSGDAIYLSGDAIYLSGGVIYPSGDRIYLSGDVIYPSRGRIDPSGDAIYPSGDRIDRSGGGTVLNRDTTWVDRGGNGGLRWRFTHRNGCQIYALGWAIELDRGGYGPMPMVPTIR